jgi:hypothetical protein
MAWLQFFQNEKPLASEHHVLGEPPQQGEISPLGIVTVTSD